jgi:hypothetical protein
MVINSFESRNCMEQMGRCNIHPKAPHVFLVVGGGGLGGEIFHFFGVPMHSHHVPKKVPMCSPNFQCVAKGYS